MPPGEVSVLLVHGFLDHGGVWRRVVDALEAEGCRCLSPDLPGAGARTADRGPYTLLRAADELAGLIDDRPGKRFVVVGHSMGGQIAELVAARRPARVAGLILVTAVSLAGKPLPDEARALLRDFGGDADRQRKIRDMFSLELSREALDELVDPATMMNLDATRGYYDAFVGGDPSGHDPLVYDGPILLVAAREDQIVPVAEVADARERRFPASRSVVLDGSGHWPHLEQPAALADAIAAFVRDIEA